MKRFYNTAAPITLAFLLFMLMDTPLQAQQPLLLDPATQPKFVNPLPIPPVIDVRNPTEPGLTMKMVELTQNLGLKDAQGNPFLTKVWGYKGGGYDAMYPGPTILAKSREPLKVKWLNRLPLNHFLPVDRSIHTALGVSEGEGVPVVTHLHGGHTESASDGLPMAWYTPYGAKKGPDFVKGEGSEVDEYYHYDNSQEAATLWYHDHALGLTRLNVYAGLAGFYVLTDEVEESLVGTSLPARPYDIGLAIQDRMFTADGQLHYPSMLMPMPGTPNPPNPSVLPEFFGNVILVNGMAWPVLEVEPRQYRFRVLNGSDSRFYTLFLPGVNRFWQVGSDNGLLPVPIGQNKLEIAPGERKEIIIDFSDPLLWGQTLILRNNAKAPFPNGATPNPNAEGQIMAFRVNKPLDTNYPLTPVPASLTGVSLPAPTLPPANAQPRQLVLFEGLDQYGRLMPMLGTAAGGAMTFHDPITENPGLNDTEIWEVYNLTPDAHPIHLHLVSFRVLSSQKFKGNVDPVTGVLDMQSVRLLGKPNHPGPGQDGKKDTYPVAPGEVVRLVATFDREGLYAWHCHILSHEDHDMMRPYYVGEMPEHMMAASHGHDLKGLTEGEAIEEGMFRVYPNPFSNTANLQIKMTEAAAVSVRLFDMSGRVVRSVPARQLPAGHHQLEINGADMQTGMYVFEVEVNDKRYRSKVVLAR